MRVVVREGCNRGQRMKAQTAGVYLSTHQRG